MTASQISIKFNCHKGVAIYTKRYLNSRSYLTNVKDFQEHACCKIELSDKTSLHILRLYGSLNSTSENNKLLNQLILNTSLIGGKLLILGDFNFPTINCDIYLIIVLLNSFQQHSMPSYSNMCRALHILNLIKNQLSLT